MHVNENDNAFLESKKHRFVIASKAARSISNGLQDRPKTGVTRRGEDNKVLEEKKKRRNLGTLTSYLKLPKTKENKPNEANLVQLFESAVTLFDDHHQSTISNIPVHPNKSLFDSTTLSSVSKCRVNKYKIGTIENGTFDTFDKVWNNVSSKTVYPMGLRYVFKVIYLKLKL